MNKNVKELIQMSDLEHLGCRFQVRPFVLSYVLPDSVGISFNDTFMLGRISPDEFRLSDLITGHAPAIKPKDITSVEWIPSYAPFHGLRCGVLHLNYQLRLRPYAVDHLLFPVANVQVFLRE